MIEKGVIQIQNSVHNFETTGELDIIDLTMVCNEFVKSSSIKSGSLLLFVKGSTGALGTTEYEPGLLEDNKSIFKKLIPKGANYFHDRIDDNAHSHLRSTLIGSDLTIPIIDNSLFLGTWQQVVFFEFDTRPRRRQVACQIIGI